MNSAHDLGGMQGFGPVIPEPVNPVFHGDWEARALAITLAMGASGKWNIDKSRHARESLPPAQYLTSTYYEIWIAALIKLMISEGLVSETEVATGKSEAPPAPVAGVLEPEKVVGVLKAGGPCDRPADTAARFAPGDKVRVIKRNPLGHTRAPRYVRGVIGTIAAVNGGYVYPDSNAHDLGEDPRWLYTVEFAAQAVWGKEARPGDRIMADLWEPYLETP
ncbi:MAG: nitrile hydratase subunit beta [Pseudomonadota bacterium]